MLDLNLIRDKTDFVKSEIAKLNETAPIDEIIELDRRRRTLLSETETLKAERNAGSKETGKKQAGIERDSHIARMRELGDRISTIDAEVTEVDRALRHNLLLVPNLPEPGVPIGKDDSENVVTETWGAPREFDFTPKPHWELGEALGIIDFERGIKVSGSRFYMLRGAGAKLQRALISWMLDLHTEKQGYSEVYPPYLVRDEALIGTGNLPKFAENQYRDDESGLWLIPTAEVPVTNMYGGEILDAGQLPVNHVAYSACFRREQLSGGRDVRGIKRGHQFDKVEMVKFCTPETSVTEHATLIDDAAEVLEVLNLPYRKVQMCTGDLSFVSANKIDLETWAPGAEEWLEVSSCANFHDFQARRANIRYRPAEGERPRFVHTLNGSGLALPRTMISVIENYQRADGSIDVPEPLRAYMGGMERISGI
ncbi:serine--tRNA ligase [soil metagenome]